MKIFNRKYLKSFRQDLRNNSTQAEIILWNEIKHSQLNGRKFRRQQSIGKYIVDFYCPAEKIAIELDGDVHLNKEQIARDSIRDEYLRSLGITVLRFENKLVLKNIDVVLKEIGNHFKSGS